MTNERMIELLEEILKWIRLQGMLAVREVLLGALKMDKEKLVYHYSDGRSSREVARSAGLKDHKVVVRYWKKWATLGIVAPIKVRRGIRYKRVFSLLDLGIEIPRAEERIREVEGTAKAPTEKQKGEE